MTLRTLKCSAKCAIAAAITVTCAAGAHAADNAGQGPSAVEEIYVLRSVREARGKPSEFCTKLKEPGWEDQYTFRAVATEEATGRVSNPNAKPVGSIRACFGKTADANLLEFYGEAMINGIAAKATGACQTAKKDFPEPGINLFACLFELYELPAEYAGGQLTTNSVSSSELFGTESKPAGYTQVSIATIRLWKKR